MKVGIVGFGTVGQAQYSILKDCDIHIFDTNKNLYPNFIDLISSEIIFICLPSETIDNKQNISEINSTLQLLYNERYSGVVILKSTVLYDKIKHWCTKLKLIYIPEFLSDIKSFEDIASQNYIIIGGDIHNSKIAEEFFKQYTTIKSPSFEFVSLQDAINIKYIRNIYGAYKVLFWEYVQDVTGNARKMFDLYSKLPYQGNMAQVGMDGYRGYGGKCFTKDVIAYDTNKPHELTEFMIDFNQRLQNE